MRARVAAAMALGVGVAVGVGACGGARSPARGAAHGAAARVESDAGGAARDAGPSEDAEAYEMPTVDALAARASDEAPGMREVARAELTIEPSSAASASSTTASASSAASADAGSAAVAEREVLRVGATDGCVRVVFAASAPVTAEIVDAAHHVLVTSGAAPRHEGGLGERGPACARRGDTLTARFVAARGASRAPVVVRLIVWASP